jgi:type I restriction enzyme S subunit
MRPYLRVANVFEDRIDASDVMEMNFSDEQFERYRLVPGDVLLNEGQSPYLLGRPAIYRGDPPNVAYTNSLIRFRAGAAVDPRWALAVFRHYLRAKRFMKESRITTNIAHLSAQRFAGIEFPVPPLLEQERIVAAIEEQFSRLDEADRLLHRSILHSSRMQGAIAEQSHAVSCEARPLQEIALFVTDGDHRPPPRVPAGVPHLTAKHVRNGAILFDDCTFVSEEGFKQTSKRYAPMAGDVLVTCVGTVGETAVVPEGVRFSADRNLAGVRLPELGAVRPHYLQLVLSSPAYQRQLLSASGSTAQPHLYLRDLRKIEVPVPPLQHQDTLIAEAQRLTSLLAALNTAIEHADVRSDRLRRSILDAAFTGNLVRQDPSDEPASVRLERIAAESGSSPKRTSSRKARIASRQKAKA